MGALANRAGRCAAVGPLTGQRPPAVIADGAASAHQRWTVAAERTLRAGGLCLEVAGLGTANGTLVQLGPCTGASAQQWYRYATPAGQLLINYRVGRCLEVPSGTPPAGTQLQLWDCNGSALRQFWTLP